MQLNAVNRTASFVGSEGGGARYELLLTATVTNKTGKPASLTGSATSSISGSVEFGPIATPSYSSASSWSVSVVARPGEMVTGIVRLIGADGVSAGSKLFAWTSPIPAVAPQADKPPAVTTTAPPSDPPTTDTTSPKPPESGRTPSGTTGRSSTPPIPPGVQRTPPSLPPKDTTPIGPGPVGLISAAVLSGAPPVQQTTNDEEKDPGELRLEYTLRYKDGGVRDELGKRGYIRGDDEDYVTIEVELFSGTTTGQLVSQPEFQLTPGSGKIQNSQKTKTWGGSFGYSFDVSHA